MGQPLALLDLDGSVADFPGALLKVFNARTGQSLDAAKWIHYRIEDQYDPDTASALYGILNEPGFFATLPVYDRAIEAVRELAALAHIEVCTTPPTIKLPSGRKVLNDRAAADKVGWVIRNFPDLGASMTITDKKHVMRADMLVDDSASNVLRWCGENEEGIGYLVEQPWNADVALPANCVRGPLSAAPATLRSHLDKKAQRRHASGGVFVLSEVERDPPPATARVLGVFRDKLAALGAALEWARDEEADGDFWDALDEEQAFMWREAMEAQDGLAMLEILRALDENEVQPLHTLSLEFMGVRQGQA